MPLTPLDTAGGPAFVNLADVTLVTAPYQVKQYAPARTVGLTGGHRVYVLNTKANCEKLLGAEIAGQFTYPPAPRGKAAKGKAPRGKKPSGPKRSFHQFPGGLEV